MYGVLQKSVKATKWKYMALLCPYIRGYNAWPTRLDVNRGVAHCPAQLFPSPWQTFVEFIFPQKFSWFDNSCCMWKLVIYKGANYIHFATELILEPKHESCTVRNFSDHWLDFHNESKSFTIIFICRSVRLSISLYIAPSLGKSHPLANIPSIRQCMSPVCPTLCIKFQLQSLAWLANQSIHTWAEIYHPYESFVFIFSVIHCWILIQYCIRPPRSIFTRGHMVWSWWAPYVHQPVCVSIIFKQM